MKATLLYLLQVIISSGLLYSYYHFFLRNRRFHQYNRFYLLLSSLVSLIIPFLDIPLYFNKADKESFVIQTLSSFSFQETEDTVATTATTILSPETSSWLSWQNTIWLLYVLIVLIICLRILFSLAKIRHLKRSNPVQPLGKVQFVSTNEPNTPFSFFRWLFWNRDIELQSPKGEQLFRHELFHIEQKHSYDVLYMEILSAVFWINPFFHLVRKEIKAIHEFLADSFAIRENEKWQYAELLLMQAFQTRQPLVNPFFNTQIKRRIAMIITSKKPRFQYLRKMMVLPLFALTFALFAFKYANKNDELPGTITVVIDAGHGGADLGATASDGTLEKNIVLSIAQKIRDLNKNEQIRIILTRNSDEFPTLASRVEKIKQHKANLFLSLHINSEPAKGAEKTGVEIAISGKNKAFESENKMMASILLDRFSSLYSTKKELVQKKQGIYVLDNSTCPSVLVECGYLTNAKDLAFITNELNQEKIAETLLSAIRQYVSQGNKTNDPASQQQTSTETLTVSNPGLTTAVDTTPEPTRIEPYFPGGINGWNKYLEQNIKASVPVDAGAPPGSYTVVVQFMVHKDGKLSDIKPLTQHGYGMEAEVLRLISNGPKWNPVMINGKYQDHYKTQKVTFEVSEESGQSIPVANIRMERGESMPSFPGGEEKWKLFLQTNLNNAVPVQYKAPRGKYTVIILISLDSEGSITNVKPLTKHGYGMEEEAMRVVKNVPKWESAVIWGRRTGSSLKQRITFTVDDGDKKAPVTKHLTDPKPVQANNKVFEKVEVSAQFPGGQEKWILYLQANLNTRVPVIRKAPDGDYTVVIHFIVNVDGTITGIKALTKHGYGMEEEALRILRNGPKWQPAIINGTEVAAYKIQPVNFKVGKGFDYSQHITSK